MSDQASSQNFYRSVIMLSPYFRSRMRVNDMALLEPETQAAVHAIMEDSAAAGMPLICFETYRSAERQAILYQQGATQLRTVGVHHYGLAADLIKDAGGEPSWKGDFSFLGELARKHGLVWGGDWAQPGTRHSFVDADHVQRCNVADQGKLFAGSWYPDRNYMPIPG